MCHTLTMSYAVVFNGAAIACQCDVCGHLWLVRKGRAVPRRCANPKKRCWHWNDGVLIEAERVHLEDHSRLREVLTIVPELTYDRSESQE